jgi:hypothetical protein
MSIRQKQLVNSNFHSHLLYDSTHDLIYGCGLSTAFAHDHLSGFVIWLIIFSEGFRRYSRKLADLASYSSPVSIIPLERLFLLGFRHGFASLFFSIIVLLTGYISGGIFIELERNFHIDDSYLGKEYLYSMLYGGILYTALVTLVSETCHRLE